MYITINHKQRGCEGISSSKQIVVLTLASEVLYARRVFQVFKKDGYMVHVTVYGRFQGSRDLILVLNRYIIELNAGVPYISPLFEKKVLFIYSQPIFFYYSSLYNQSILGRNYFKHFKDLTTYLLTH